LDNTIKKSKIQEKFFIIKELINPMEGEKSKSNNREDNSKLRNENFSQKFKYSIAVGFTSFGAIFVIANYFSTRYLSPSMKFSLFLLFFILLMASIGFFGVIIIKGILLVEPLKRFHDPAELISEAFFTCGLSSAFVAALYSLFLIPFGALVLSQLNSSTLIICFSVIYAICLYIVILKILGIKFSDTKSSKIETLIAIFIIVFSFFSTDYVCQNSYTILIDADERYYNDQGQEIYIVIVKVAGFASFDNLELHKVKVYSKDLVLEKEGELHLVEKEVYYTELNLSDLEIGVYFVYFGTEYYRIMKWNKILDKTEILVVDKTEGG